MGLIVSLWKLCLWLQGLYTTFYGPHGMETLHITYGMMEPPLSTLLPHGKCFTGLKVTPRAFCMPCCGSEACRRQDAQQCDVPGGQG